MLDNFVDFLKRTFTYAEESNAQTPPTVKTNAQPASAAQPKQQPVRQAVQQSAPKPRVNVTVKGESDPLKNAQQQTDNFNAMRPKPGDNPFRMTIDKVMFAKGRGVVVIGTVGKGIVKAGTNALIVHAANKTTIRTRIVEIGRNNQLVSTAPAGSAVGLLLEEITRDDVHAGDVIGEIA